MCQQRTASRRPAAIVQSSNPPAPSEISRILASDTLKEEYILQSTGVTECAFAHLRIVSGLIYCCGGVANGIMSASAGTTYLGRSHRYLTEVRASGDENVPVLISETASSELQSARTYVQGTAGDRLVLIYQAH